MVCISIRRRTRKSLEHQNDTMWLTWIHYISLSDVIFRVKITSMILASWIRKDSSDRYSKVLAPSAGSEDVDVRGEDHVLLLLLLRWRSSKHGAGLLAQPQGLLQRLEVALRVAQFCRQPDVHAHDTAQAEVPIPPSAEWHERSMSEQAAGRASGRASGRAGQSLNLLEPDLPVSVAARG